MCKILLSINPEYSNQILQGTKKYEFRRILPKRTVDEILIYSTSPDMKVVGSVKVNEILMDTPINLWQKTKQHAGISEEKFLAYFENKETAFAYQLGAVKKYAHPKKLSDYGIQTAPQSFVYI
ncbi:MAG: ASCH domain-containing protein [Treponema sp.]|jgi:predicted transcriptional regulator|nr:ASCH domain-containing protein [Treponema sp.]